MELDELKTKWHELDGRLSCADTKIDRLTAEVSAGKITSAKQRLARTIRLGIFLLAALPLCFANLFRTGEADPGTAVKATLALFIFAMLARQIALLVLLARIEPGNRTVRETCAAVLRFRTCFLWGVGAGIALGVPLLILLGFYMGSLTSPYVFYGFVAGLIVGLPLGVRIFLRMMGDINALRAAAYHAVDHVVSAAAYAHDLDADNVLRAGFQSKSHVCSSCHNLYENDGLSPGKCYILYCITNWRKRQVQALNLPKKFCAGSMKHLRSVPDAVRYARYHSGMNRAFPSCIILITPFSLTSSFSTTAIR